MRRFKYLGVYNLNLIKTTIVILLIGCSPPLNLLLNLLHCKCVFFNITALISELTPTRNCPTSSECDLQTRRPPPRTLPLPPKRRLSTSDSNVTVPHIRDPETAASPRKLSPGTSCFDIFINDVVRRLCYMQD